MWVCFIYFMLLFLALPEDGSGIIKRCFLVCNTVVLSRLGEAKATKKRKKDYYTWMFGLIASEVIRTGQYGSLSGPKSVFIDSSKTGKKKKLRCTFPSAALFASFGLISATHDLSVIILNEKGGAEGLIFQELGHSCVRAQEDTTPPPQTLGHLPPSH